MHQRRYELDFDRVALEYTGNGLTRADFTIIQGEKPILVLEAKCQYRNDTICHKKKDREAYEKDLKKLRELKNRGIESYFALFIVHFEPEYPHFKYGQPNKGKENIDRSKIEDVFNDYNPPCKPKIVNLGIYKYTEKNEQKQAVVTLETWLYKI